MNALDLIAYTRSILDASQGQSGSGPWSDSDLLSYLSAAQRQLWAVQVDTNPWPYLLTATLADLGLTFTTVTPGLIRAKMPRYVFRIEMLMALITDGLEPVPVVGLQSLQNTVSDRYASNETPSWFVGHGGDLYFTASAVDTSCYLAFYSMRPPDLVVFTASADGTTTTTLATKAESETLGALRSDSQAYSGTTMEVVSADESLPEGELLRVSASAVTSYPTIRLTHDALSAAVEEGDTIAMVPLIDESFHELLCYMAALRALDQEGNLRDKDTLAQTTKDLYQRWLSINRRGQGQDEARMSYER